MNVNSLRFLVLFLCLSFPGYSTTAPSKELPALLARIQLCGTSFSPSSELGVVSLRSILNYRGIEPVDIFQREIQIRPELKPLYSHLAKQTRGILFYWSDGDYSARSGDKIFLSPMLLDSDEALVSLFLRVVYELAYHKDHREVFDFMLRKPEMTRVQFVRRGTDILLTSEIHRINAEIAALDHVRRAGISIPALYLHPTTFKVYQANNPQKARQIVLEDGYYPQRWTRYLELLWEESRGEIHHLP